MPTQSCASPEASAASTSRFSFAFMEPVSFATRMPKGSRKPVSVAKCCSASISVGAIKADCAPDRAAYQTQAAATRVLPLPTSPWTSRFMSCPERMSRTASPMARSWAPVGEKGREEVNSSSRASLSRRPAALSRPPRSSPSAQARTKSSSNTSLRRESSSARMSAGKCTFSYAYRAEQSRYSSATRMGSPSGVQSPAMSSAWRTAARATFCESPTVRR